MIRVVNRWNGPLVVDFGPPLGKVRLPAGSTELDVEFNDLQLPKYTQARVDRGTLELIDVEAEKLAAGAEAKEKKESKK